MSNTPYDYSTRLNVLPISWEDVQALPVARGGYYSDALLAHILAAESYLIHLTRRADDRRLRESLVWLQEPPAAAGPRCELSDSCRFAYGRKGI